MGNSTSNKGQSEGQKSKEIFVQMLNNQVSHMQADVIIAFVDTGWNLNDEILKGMERKGGETFVSEWNKMRDQQIGNCQVGDVFCVKSGGLPCRYLFFAVWRESDASGTDDVHLNFVVENMLERSQTLEEDVCTIAVPLGSGMTVETHVNILNNVFLWLMGFDSQSVIHIHFLTSNKVIEDSMEAALQNLKDFAQQKSEAVKNKSDVQTDSAERERDIAKVFPLRQDISEQNDTRKASIFKPIVHADEFSDRSSINSESSDNFIMCMKKSVDTFPETESIWIYYMGPFDDYTRILRKRKQRNVKFNEEADEYDFYTGRPVRRTLSQSSKDEVEELDYPNFASKKSKGRRRRRKSDEIENQSFFCTICQCEKKSSSKKTLSKCGHEFCSSCVDKYFEDVSPCCPNCNKFYGKPLGNQPDGLMSYRTTNQYLPGYPGTDTIIIEYDIPDGIQSEKHPNPGVPFKGTQRTAYLPDTEQGRKVFRMLQQAFNQRLVFTVGKSRTTGRENVVTWNDIHHKTRPNGGPERFGYPDPEYLDRVEKELKRAGIADETTVIHRAMRTTL